MPSPSHVKIYIIKTFGCTQFQFELIPIFIYCMPYFEFHSNFSSSTYFISVWFEMDSLSVHIGVCVCAIELNEFAAFYECILHFDFDHNQIEKF